MRDVVEEYRRWTAEPIGVGRAVVVRVIGSAPRGVGATLLVAEDGRLAGSVSGGCVESAVADQVLAARRGGYRRLVRYESTDDEGWSVGLSCGGAIDVLIEPAVRAEVIAAAEANLDAAVATWLPVGDVPAGAPGEAPSLVVDAQGNTSGTLGRLNLDRAVIQLAQESIAEGRSRTVDLPEGAVFIEVFAARPRLVVVGAGQIAIHLAALARELGFYTVVLDPRSAFATRERFPRADEIIVGWPDEVADRAGIGPQAHVAVLSHDPKIDGPALEIALRRGCRYVGLLGNRRTQADRVARLRAAGLGPEQLERLRGPIGLDLGGDSPPEIALAILAEIVAQRHGASGRPLTQGGAAT